MIILKYKISNKNKMKRTFTGVAAALLGVGMLVSSCGGGSVKTATFKGDADSVSYAIGILNGSQYLNYMAQDSTINVDDLIKGIADGAYEKGGKSSSYMQGFSIGENFRKATQQDSTVMLDNLVAGFTDALKKKGLMTEDEAMTLMNSFQQKQQEKAMAEQNAKVAKQTEAEQKMLADLSADTEIQKTASGLMYKVTELGNGAKPAATDTVTVHYKGTDVLGEVFDSSYDRGEPAVFPLNGVIAGWTEGFQLMPEGSKFTLWIPGALAYGELGAQAYGPTGLLKFECELIKVTPAK